MNRLVVNVATGRYVAGQRRLKSLVANADFYGWADCYPDGSPSHDDIPYAFKAYAIQYAIRQGCDLVLWADACIMPVEPMSDVWSLIESQGYWISRNGWTNSEWCCDDALPLLGITREEAVLQEHVVATTFGLNLRSEIGKAFAAEYLAHAKNGAFRGPWMNKNHPSYAGYPIGPRCAPCGDARVRGHRHDQTSASAIAAKLGMTLTNPPEWFAYRGGEVASTRLIADGSY